MSDQLKSNPYAAGGTDSKGPHFALSRVHSVLMILMAIVLIVRGGFMTVEWFRLLANGFDFSRPIYCAIFCKDVVTCVTALAGGIMIVARQSIGWWLATIFWSWYLSWNSIIVVLAETLAWKLPIRQVAPELYRKAAISCVIACLAIAFLNWRPTMNALHVSLERRIPYVCSVLVGSLAITLMINWWSGFS